MFADSAARTEGQRVNIQWLFFLCFFLTAFCGVIVFLQFPSVTVGTWPLEAEVY